jgi:CRISPR/Cas system-associated endonuclease Cas3-HD
MNETLHDMGKNKPLSQNQHQYMCLFSMRHVFFTRKLELNGSTSLKNESYNMTIGQNDKHYN